MSEAQPAKVAVALEYEHGVRRAPRVTAKGRGAVADRIVATAQEHGVAVEENPLLAEALSRVPLDEEIPEELYRAVAAVLTFVLRATARQRR